MAYTFIDATLLSYDIANNFLGEGLFSLNSKKNISIKGILDNRSSNIGEGVKDSIEDIKNISTGIFDIYDDIFVNGYNLGIGKITSVSFPKNNPIRIGEYQYDIEITNSSNFSNINTGQIYGVYLQNLTGRILNLNEGFNFNYEANGKYRYVHNIEVQYQDDKTDIIQKAKDLAFNLFNENLSLGLLNPFSGIYKDFRNKKNYYNEVYNMVDGTCSFTKEVEFNLNKTENYTLNMDHSLSYDQNGKLRVEENGTILALDNTLAFTAENYLNEVISNSYSRCQNLVSKYIQNYGLFKSPQDSPMRVYDNLNATPYSFGKTINPFSNSLQYKIGYVNDLSFEGNIINNYTATFSKDERGVSNYVENGQLLKIGQIGTINNLNDFKTKYLAAKVRATGAYPNLLNSSFSIGKLGSTLYNNQFSYTLESTSDPALRPETDKIFKYVQTKIEDKKPVTISKEYIIANRNPKNIYFLYGNNMELGEKSVMVEGSLVRPSGNIWEKPVDFPINQLKEMAIKNGLNLISDEAYINDVSYQYNSENKFSFRFSVKYNYPSGYYTGYTQGIL